MVNKSLAEEGEFDTQSTSRLADLFFAYLEREHIISRPALARMLEAQDQPPLIPCCVFSNRSMGGFEAVVKFLRESCGMSLKEIAASTYRSPSTIGVAYHASRKKCPAPLDPSLISRERHFVPLSALATRRLAPLETVVCHLKEHYDLTFHQIAVALNRDDRTIWTAFHRAQKKGERNG